MRTCSKTRIREFSASRANAKSLLLLWVSPETVFQRRTSISMNRVDSNSAICCSQMTKTHRFKLTSCSLLWLILTKTKKTRSKWKSSRMNFKPQRMSLSLRDRPSSTNLLIWLPIKLLNCRHSWIKRWKRMRCSLESTKSMIRWSKNLSSLTRRRRVLRANWLMLRNHVNTSPMTSFQLFRLLRNN